MSTFGLIIFRMNYYQMPPVSALAPYVRFFWVLEGEPGLDGVYAHRSMADGCAEMIFHYSGLFDVVKGAGSSIRSGIDAQASTFRRYQTRETFGIFGAYLYPYTIPALLGHDASALSDQMPDLVSLLGQTGRDLEEQMMTAVDNTRRAGILTSFLLGRLQKVKWTEPFCFESVRFVNHSKGTVPVKKLAEQFCLSTRQFETKFRMAAGFSPKTYSRIIRFQAAIAHYGNSDHSLTDIAHRCGYYDQSHFIHDFKEFSGFHPRHYFRGMNEATGWKENP